MFLGCISFQVIPVKDEFMVQVMLRFELIDEADESGPLASFVLVTLVKHLLVMLETNENL